jgi:hypothetical protein
MTSEGVVVVIFEVFVESCAILSIVIQRRSVLKLVNAPILPVNMGLGGTASPVDVGFEGM